MAIIIETSCMPIKDIGRDVKKHTSAQLKKAITENMQRLTNGMDAMDDGMFREK